MTVETKEKRETFTAGPWKIKNGKNYYHIHGEQEVALVENWMNETPRANARLIASAPEMYELCKLLLPVMQRDAKDRHIRAGESRRGEHADNLREILAKVEGGGS